MNALELTAQRQAVWSATANSIKTMLERVRWATFALFLAAFAWGFWKWRTTAAQRTAQHAHS